MSGYVQRYCELRESEIRASDIVTDLEASLRRAAKDYSSMLIILDERRKALADLESSVCHLLGEEALKKLKQPQFQSNV